MSEENPASLVTLASPVRSRIEFYSDAEADAIIRVGPVQPGLRWQVGGCSSSSRAALSIPACAPANW